MCIHIYAIVKENICKYLTVNDMQQKLDLSDDRVVHMSDKRDGHYVAIFNDAQSIRLRSSRGHLLKYCLGLEAIPSLPPGVELRAELVLEKDTAKSSYEQFVDTNAMFSHVGLTSNAPNPFLDLRDLTEWESCDEHAVPCKMSTGTTSTPSWWRSTLRAPTRTSSRLSGPKSPLWCRRSGACRPPLRPTRRAWSFSCKSWSRCSPRRRAATLRQTAAHAAPSPSRKPLARWWARSGSREKSARASQARS